MTRTPIQLAAAMILLCAAGCGDDDDKKTDTSLADTSTGDTGSGDSAADTADDSAADTTPDDSAADTTPDDSAADTTPDDTAGDIADTSPGDVTADPGSLIAVSMDSTIAVLLDEIPESARDRAVADILAKPAEFWIDRAKRQIDMTSYRLLFRNFYYEPEEQKHILPPPPVETWHIELAGAAERRTIDGHDVVAVDYTWTGTLLGPEDEPVKSDGRLTGPGAVVEEEYILPVDPEHLIERTGYACMDEADFPPNSVDTENARLFYDDLCEGETLIDDGGCHLTEPIPSESCPEAVVAAVGSVATSVRFERLAWDDAIADLARVGSQLPGVSELRAMPEGVADNRIVYRYYGENSCAISEGCIGGAGWRRLLQFTATVQNLGAEDAALGDTSPGSGPVVNNVVSFSGCHQHMHFNHYGAFTFGSGEEQLGSKRAFCLESTWRYFNNEDTPLTHPYDCVYQGTAAGWGDDYIAGLDCQWVDITPVDTSVAPVTSTLSFHVNPDKFLCEGAVITDVEGEMTYEPTDFLTEAGEVESRIACEETAPAADNNVAELEVTVPTDNGGLVTSPCTRGQIGPARNCGFQNSGATIDCVAGSATTLECTGGSAEAPVAVRLCEASTKLGAIPCTYNEARATATLVGGTTSVQLTCPAVRSETLGELGGAVGLYAAPLIPGDAFDVSCTTLP